MNITQKRLKELLKYSPDTGELVWVAQSSNRIKVGEVAGTMLTNGYLNISIDGQRYRAHRLAWLYVYGDLPINQIDHINRNKIDNRIVNLREVSNKENHRNMPLQRNNKTRISGVGWCRSQGRWRSHITVDGRFIHLGYRDSMLDAAAIRKSAEYKHGFHANHGDDVRPL